MPTSAKQTYFDDATLLLYEDHSPLLLNQLCHGDAKLSHTILSHEMAHFLKGAPDTTKTLKRAKQTAKQTAKSCDIDELCHLLKTQQRRRGLFERLFRSLSSSIALSYHLFLQNLSASHYLAKFMHRLRMDNARAMFQFLFFVPTPSSLRLQTTRKQFVDNGFLRITRSLYGEEFFLVEVVEELQRIKHQYVTERKQLSFMLQGKGFNLDDAFSGRNPAYYFTSGTDRKILQLLKSKVDRIVHNCTLLIDTIKNHTKFKTTYASQFKARRELVEKRRKEMQEEFARQQQLNLQQQRNNIELHKVGINDVRMQERNNIELQKLLLSQQRQQGT